MSIIINVYDKNLFRKALDNLFSKTLLNFEIICINECNDDITTIVNEYKNKFYNIKIIDFEENKYFFNKIISETNGVYTLLTKLNNLISKEYIEIINEHFIESFNYKYDINLFNINEFENNEDNKLLEKLTENVKNSDDLTISELYLLYKTDCDIRLSNKFIIKKADLKIKNLSYEPITYLDLLIKANKIHLSQISFNNKKRKNLVKLNNKAFLEKKENNKEKIKFLRNNIPLQIKENEIIPYNENNKGKSKDPKISIIIPVYNPKRYHIQVAMISLFNQTFNFNDLEIIFMNDMSEKTSGIDLIKEYSEEYSNIKLYHTLVNSGSGIARNIALDHAKGKYIMFLDHDDYYFRIHVKYCIIPLKKMKISNLFMEIIFDLI